MKSVSDLTLNELNLLVAKLEGVEVELYEDRGNVWAGAGNDYDVFSPFV